MTKVLKDPVTGVELIFADELAARYEAAGYIPAKGQGKSKSAKGQGKAKAGGESVDPVTKDSANDEATEDIIGID